MASRPVNGRTQSLELYLHPGDEYLGSLEPESLQVLAYVKLYMVDMKSLEIKTSCVPMNFPKDKPPFLRKGDSIVASGAENVITYLREQLSGVEGRLQESEQAELTAYSALLTDRLLPAMLYSKWLNAKNYVDFTRPSYGKILFFPLSLFYLSWQHRAVNHLLMRGTPPDTTEEQRGFELVSKAEECIGLIAARVGGRDYFCGERPSSLDVYMYGYLESILQSPHSDADQLSIKLSSSTNLVSFCQRVRKNLFSDKKSRTTTTSPVLTVTRPTSLWRDSALWMSVGVATLVLCAQGVRVGLFRELREQITYSTQSNSEQQQ